MLCGGDYCNFVLSRELFIVVDEPSETVYSFTISELPYLKLALLALVALTGAIAAALMLWRVLDNRLWLLILLCAITPLLAMVCAVNASFPFLVFDNLPFQDFAICVNIICNLMMLVMYSGVQLVLLLQSKFTPKAAA